MRIKHVCNNRDVGAYHSENIINFYCNNLPVAAKMEVSVLFHPYEDF